MKGAIELPSFTGKITGLHSLVHIHLNKDRAGGIALMHSRVIFPFMFNIWYNVLKALASA